MPAPDLTDVSISDLLDLSGKTAVVTGGAQGLGKAIGKRLAEAGAVVYLADIAEDKAVEAASDMPGTAHGVELDATDPQANVALAEHVFDEHGSLDIWVNNAGIYPFSELLDMELDEWNKVVELNLNGVFYGAQAAGTKMAEQGSGVIVNMSSTAGYGAEGGNIAHYVATKHGVRGLTKALAVELGPKGVRSLALSPTLIKTPGTDALNEDGTNEQVQQLADRIPLGRVGVPDDVARVVLFAVSGLSAFVSGDTILVDGALRSN